MGLIGLFLAIVLIIVLSFKELNIVVAAPLATILVLLTNQTNLLSGMLGPEGSYLLAMGQFIINTFGLFLLGSILAQYMEHSRASESIARFILSKIGIDKPYIVFLALTAVSGILTYGGISIFVVIFALVSISRPILKEMDVNWELVRIPLIIGASTITLSMLPGSPSVSNALPAQTLGTGLTAAPFVSVITSIVVTTFCLVYMYLILKKSLDKGESFYTYLEKDKSLKAPVEKVREEGVKLPSFGIAVIPLVVLISINLIFGQVPNIIYISLTIGIILCAILYRPYLQDNLQVLNLAAQGSTSSVMYTSSAVAFGTMMTSTSAFGLIQNALSSLFSNPLINLTLISAILSGITGSSSGTVGIALSELAPEIISQGFDPEIVHRLIVISSAILTTVPFSGVIITFQNVAGLSYKTSYIHTFLIVTLSHLIGAVVVIFLNGLMG